MEVEVLWKKRDGESVKREMDHCSHYLTSSIVNSSSLHLISLPSMCYLTI